MKIVSYLNGIPKRNNNQQKPLILHNFVEGVKKNGDEGILHTGWHPIPSDVGVIQGFVHDDGKQAPHLVCRQNVLNYYAKNKGRTVIADSNLFLYLNKTNPLNYLRYSFDGVFPNTGFYFTKVIDSNRWKKISRDYACSLKDYKQGNNLLICLQRNGGWSMRGLSVIDFLKKTIPEIKKFTDRPIVLRPHPGDKKSINYLKDHWIRGQKLHISTGELKTDLQRAWCTITFNSSPGIASLLEGVPVFALDPDLKHCQYAEMANTDLARIENPTLYERQKWIEKISMCHWNFDELKNGEAWNYMRQFVYDQ